MFDAICQQLKYATKNGDLRSAITVFPKRQPLQSDFRVWNQHLISYAGYLQDDGTVVGDPAGLKMTEVTKTYFKSIQQRLNPIIM